jgi:hypothetical protein
MLKAEIAVGNYSYVFSFPEFTCHSDVMKLVRDKLVNEFPENRQFCNDQGDLIEINCRDRYDHIRVFDDTTESQTVLPEVEVPSPAPAEPQSGPFRFDGSATYLGQRFAIAGMAHMSEFGTLLLPTLLTTSVGNTYSFDEMVSKDSQERVLAEWAIQNGYQDGEFMCVFPPAPINDQEEVIAYLKDYLAELRKKAKALPVDNKTAIAFNRED